ncbi:hypothetical protein ACFQV2_27610 [Actinokineospora soli]|uniref:Uncharacterized protein n=1 Tax=Actinokineospora soli TaxID=1048753 RepID=A0ABW2TV26_9PSEU
MLAMLAHVAATLHDHHPQGEIAEGRLLDVVERALLGPAWYTRPAPERLGVELLEVLRTKVGVLNEIGTRTYAFSHLTVQEYLAGLTLVPESGEVTAAMLASMADRLGDPRWREPVALALDGLSPSARTVLLRVVARSAAEVDVWAEVALSTGQVGDDAELVALAELAFTGCRELRDHPDLLADLVERIAAVRRKAGPARFDRLAMALPESLLPVVAAVFWRRRWLSDPVLTAFTRMSDTVEHAAWGRPVDRALRRAVSGPAPEIPLLDAPPRTGDVRLVELGLPAWHRARREHAEREVGTPLPGSLPLRDLFTGDPARWERCVSDPRRAAALVVLLGGLDDRDAVAADARYGELADLLALPENPRTQAITESAATLVPHFGADDTVYETAVFLDTRSKKLLVRHAPEPLLDPRLATKPVGPTLTAALLAWAQESPDDTGSLRDRLTGVAATGSSTERSEARLALAVLDGTPPPPDTDRARDRALPWVADAAIRALPHWLHAAGGGPALLHLRILCAEVAGRPLDLPAQASSDVLARADRLAAALAQVDPDSRGSAPRWAGSTPTSSRGSPASRPGPPRPAAPPPPCRQTPPSLPWTAWTWWRLL